MMLAWREFQVRSPDSISAFLQRDGFLIPVRKVSGQLHVGRTWGADGEGLRSPLMVIARCYLFHFISWLSMAGSAPAGFG